MLDIVCYDFAWDESLMPIGNDTWEKENFQSWYSRVSNNLANLHPQIAEQWVYRHWQQSPYSFLFLEKLAWKLESWSTKRLLSCVFSRTGSFDAKNGEDDYAVFRKYAGNATATPIDTNGTWDYPVVLLHTPSGVINWNGEQPDIRYLLIEGHKRMRCLNAVASKGAENLLPKHDVFILNYKE